MDVVHLYGRKLQLQRHAHNLHLSLLRFAIIEVYHLKANKVTNMIHNQNGDLHAFPQELPHIIGEATNWEEPLSTDCISYNFIICLPLVCTTFNVMKASIPTFEDLLYHITSFTSGKVEDDTNAKTWSLDLLLCNPRSIGKYS
jgi:hypothetical protein